MHKFNKRSENNLSSQAFDKNIRKGLKKLLFIIVVLILVLIVMIAVPLFELLP